VLFVLRWLILQQKYINTRGQSKLFQHFSMKLLTFFVNNNLVDIFNPEPALNFSHFGGYANFMA
jgi:hypothetical protein